MKVARQQAQGALRFGDDHDAGRGAVELTEAGTTLACKLSDIFARLDQALDPEVNRARSEIHISAMPSLAAKWLAPRLPGFEARYPQWALRLDVDRTRACRRVPSRPAAIPPRGPPPSRPR